MTEEPIRVGDRFFKPGQKTKYSAPDRTYKVIEIRSPWDIRCQVDPPLKKSYMPDVAMASELSLRRMQPLPRED